MWDSVPNEPSIKNLTSDFGKLSTTQLQSVQRVAKPHVDSFNTLLSDGLATTFNEDVDPLEFELPSKSRISLKITNAVVAFPSVSSSSHYVATQRIFPAECRLRRATYQAPLLVQLKVHVDGKLLSAEEKMIGEIPIMVKSNRCNIARMSPKELVAHGEEAEEFGGYFIVNGLEKVIRMTVVQRRNYPIPMARSAWKKRDKLFSEFGVTIRCVKSNETMTTNVLHYLTNGTAKLMFSYSREMFFVPILLLLKAFRDISDRELFNILMRGHESDAPFRGCIINMLQQISEESLHNRKKVLNFIGMRFRRALYCPDWYTNEKAAEMLLKECICIHLDTNEEKFNLLVSMMVQLFAVVKGTCVVESADNPMNHEILLSGSLYLTILREKVAAWLQGLRYIILKKAQSVGPSYALNNANFMWALKSTRDVTRAVAYFLSTGNVVSTRGLGLPQVSGYSVVAEKLNYLRYLSHFRSVHRGAFFATMRTTDVRKLLPESWGFICPVHTPDGAPCGLLNHLTAMCEIVARNYDSRHIPLLLYNLGMTPIDACPPDSCDKCYTVMLDGRVCGWIAEEKGTEFVFRLRRLKVCGSKEVPSHLEVCLIPRIGQKGQNPGLYLFTTPGRMTRPVTNLAFGGVEMIGTLEQIYMNISVTPWEIYPDVTTHQELRETAMLSILANMIPLSDFNQSPRNMYQCQMAKQTLGTPSHALQARADTKVYRLYTPQSPLFRPAFYDYYHLDDYATGTNAVVAVISYTGYDMEDAMIINKSSFERGFAHGSVYKSMDVDLRETTRSVTVTELFGRKPASEVDDNIIGPDGLPLIGVFLEYNDPMCCVVSTTTGEERVIKYSSKEGAYVDSVLILGSDTGTQGLNHVCVKLRIPRNPIIGDKFASRAGQKGICSQMWNQADMPFTESGMTPDIIFNPHGFPSRMTIGMMIEVMAGKSGAAHGLVHDASPFKFSEDDPGVDYFGRLLEAAGYNYYGTEKMYSGVDGRELEVNIFFGMVYYQRLRHMVSDKFQVRTTGPIDRLTHQPVKGRKRAGGIRFGEMERDSLIAHGVSFLLQDRLFNCSDKDEEHICTKCGNLLSTVQRAPKTALLRDATRVWTCTVCDSSDHIRVVNLPYVFRYLAVELAAVNIRVVLEVENK